MIQFLFNFPSNVLKVRIRILKIKSEGIACLISTVVCTLPLVENVKNLGSQHNFFFCSNRFNKRKRYAGYLDLRHCMYCVQKGTVKRAIEG
jgi:hypothetical protein